MKICLGSRLAMGLVFFSLIAPSIADAAPRKLYEVTPTYGDESLLGERPVPVKSLSAVYQAFDPPRRGRSNQPPRTELVPDVPLAPLSGSFNLGHRASEGLAPPIVLSALPPVSLHKTVSEAPLAPLIQASPQSSGQLPLSLANGLYRLKGFSGTVDKARVALERRADGVLQVFAIGTRLSDGPLLQAVRLDAKGSPTVETDQGVIEDH